VIMSVALICADLSQRADGLLEKATASGVSPSVADKLLERYDRVISLIASARLIDLAAKAKLPSGCAFALAFDAYMIAETSAPGSANASSLWAKLVEQMTTLVDDASKLSAAEVSKIESEAAARKIEAAAAKYKSDKEADAVRRRSQWDSKCWIGKLFSSVE
jgi:hypothetical protein